jgi:hypothetical protein
VTHRLGLRETRQADRIAAHKIAEVRAVRFRFRQIDAGLAPAVALEDQVLVLQQAAPASQGGGLALDAVFMVLMIRAP